MRHVNIFSYNIFSRFLDHVVNPISLSNNSFFAISFLAPSSHYFSTLFICFASNMCLENLCYCAACCFPIIVIFKSLDHVVNPSSFSFWFLPPIIFLLFFSCLASNTCLDNLSFSVACYFLTLTFFRSPSSLPNNSFLAAFLVIFQSLFLESSLFVLLQTPA